METPEIWGIESISAEAVVIRLVVKTRPGSKDDVARELRARLKATLDGMGIRLPSLTAVVLSGFEGAESIRGSRPPRTRPNPVVTTEDPKPPRGAAVPKDAVPKDAVPKDAVPKDALPKGATPKDSPLKDPRSTKLPKQ
jgi:small conductance mechanosensitive channel